MTDLPARIGPVLRELRRSDPRDYHNGYRNRRLRYAICRFSVPLSRTGLPVSAQPGLDATEFSGHSLRSGFLTSAAEAGASIFKMVEVSRHKSVGTLQTRCAGMCGGLICLRNMLARRSCDLPNARRAY
jgi:hypothetical protein